MISMRPFLLHVYCFPHRTSVQIFIDLVHLVLDRYISFNHSNRYSNFVYRELIHIFVLKGTLSIFRSSDRTDHRSTAPMRFMSRQPVTF